MKERSRLQRERKELACNKERGRDKREERREERKGAGVEKRARDQTMV